MAHPRTLWLNGYQDTVLGDPFAYHGPVPDATSALLVRSNAERPAIAWRTAPVPTTATIDTLDVVWLFGLDVAPTRHRFVLHVDDRPLVTFTSPADASLEPWTVPGEQGACLTFRPTERDRHGDLLGFACLHLPAGLARRGQPLTLRVTGEDAGQPVWFLVYQRAVSPEATVEPGATVAITDDGECLRHHLQVMHLGDGGTLRVDLLGQPTVDTALRFGLNRVAVDLPLDAPGSPLSLTLPDGRSQHVNLPTRPPRRWTVDLVQHTHTDIGYTRPQSEILPEHLRYLDHALDCCDRTDHLPDDARFRWTCEALWPVVAFVRTRPAAQVARLRRRVDEGRIALTALPFNLSELADEALLHAMLAPLRELADLGLPVRLAMQDDVNGVAWCLADTLPPLGVRYLVMGQHDHRALTCFERPTAFWWESPAGSRLLAFRADHYMTGNTLGIGGGDLDAFASALLRYLSALESSGYPHDRIAIQFSGYVTDNAPPSTLACDLVQRWNQAHAWPRLRLSTAVDFLDHVAERHADSLPVHRAAWPDWWSDGIGSAPLEAAAVRRAQAQATAGDALIAAAMAAGADLPADLDRDRAEVTSALLFCAEHTYGADDSVRDPLGQDTREQWGEKSSHAWDAVGRVRLRQETAWGALQPHLPTHREHATIVVFNPLAHTRSGLAAVNVDHQVWPPHRRVTLRDPRGHEVLAQPLHHRADGTTWALWFDDVPPLGFAAVTLEVHDEPAVTPAPIAGTELSSPYYRAVVDPDRGTLRHLHDLTLGADLVDADAPWPLGACIHEQLGNRHQLEQRRLDDVVRHGLVDVRADGGHHGPIWRSLAFVGRSLATGATVRWEYRLHVASPRLELRLSLRNPGTCDPEAWYVAWPLALPGGQLRYEAQGGLVRPGRDQLVGSSSDWHAAQSLVSVVGDRGQVVLSSPETLLWQFGGLNLGRFQATAPVERPHAYSWVMNNYWTTNFRASLEGELRWGYQLTSLADGSAGAAMRAGQDARMPLMARVLPAGGRGAGRSLPGGVFRKDLPDALLIAVTPDVAGRALVLHLREAQGTGCRVPLAEVLRPELARDMVRVDGVGRVLGALEEGVDLGAHEVVFVRVGVERSRHE